MHHPGAIEEEVATMSKSAVRRVTLSALRCECQRCGHIGYVLGKGAKPWKRCPGKKCKSPYWQTPPGKLPRGRPPKPKE